MPYFACGTPSHFVLTLFPHDRYTEFNDRDLWLLCHASKRLRQLHVKGSALSAVAWGLLATKAWRGGSTYRMPEVRPGF